MNDPLIPVPEEELLPESRTADENIDEAVRHLRLAMACLDEADEVNAPPHVQMAIDMLESRDESDDPAGPSVFRF